jgi:hypothetical protein
MGHAAGTWAINKAMADIENISVREHGVCPSCLDYANGETDGVLIVRRPTLEEALAVDPNDIEKGEAWVIRDALLESVAPK